MSKRQRSSRSSAVAKPRMSRAETFLDRHGETIAEVWEKLLDVIDVSDLPVFRRDEQPGAFRRFAFLILDKFWNKVQIVGDDEEDDDDYSRSSESEELASEETLTETETSSSEEAELESDSERHPETYDNGWTASEEKQALLDEAASSDPEDVPSEE